MTVHSYSRHGIGFSLSSRLQGPFSVNIVGAMRHHLNVSAITRVGIIMVSF